MTPGGVLWLLAHELRITWRGSLGLGGKQGRRRLILWGAVGAALLFAGYWLAQVLGRVEPEASPAALGVTGLIFALLFSFMLAQTLILITESLYQRGDLDLLLASPLPPWRILLVRMGAVALNAASLYIILLGCVFVWLPFAGGWAWMGFLPSIALLSLFATGVSLVIARLMFAAVGPRATRVAAQVTASLFGAGFFLVTQAQNFAPRGDRARAMQQVFERFAPLFSDPHSALSLPARAALGAPDSLLIWAGFALAAYTLAVWWFARRFVDNAAAIAGGEGRRRRRDERTARTRGGLRVSLLRKEWRLLLRDPLLLSQILVQLLYLVPLFFIFGARLSEEGIGRYTVAAFSSAMVLIATSLAASLAWLTVSAEDAPELIAAAPVARDDIDYAKALAAGLPVTALMLAPALGAAWITPMAGVWLFLGAAASVFSACLIAVWHQAPGSRRTFRTRRRGSFAVSLGRAFVSLCWISATGFAVAGWPIVSILPVIVAVGFMLAMHESRRAAQPDAQSL